MAINTHCGLFQYNRLPFGMASAPAIFQRHMKTLLQGVDGVSVYLDDILVAGYTLDEYLNRLAEVLQRLENSGIRLNKQKCFFLHSSIEYLGHTPDRRESQSHQEAPAPTNVTQHHSFLGLVN